jgi:hypothetical protein
MKKTLVIAFLLAASPTIGMTAAGATGTTNGSAGCVAQVNTVEGPPGSSVTEIKQFVTPIPGSLISAIARTDRTSCEVPR